jgi:hypothetical protein
MVVDTEAQLPALAAGGARGNAYEITGAGWRLPGGSAAMGLFLGFRSDGRMADHAPDPIVIDTRVTCRSRESSLLLVTQMSSSARTSPPYSTSSILAARW